MGTGVVLVGVIVLPRRCGESEGNSDTSRLIVYL